MIQPIHNLTKGEMTLIQNALKHYSETVLSNPRVQEGLVSENDILILEHIQLLQHRLQYSIDEGYAAAEENES